MRLGGGGRIDRCGYYSYYMSGLQDLVEGYVGVQEVEGVWLLV